MALAEVNPLTPVERVPADVRRFIDEAYRRIGEFQTACSVPGFVPCDYEAVYRTLAFLAESSLLSGQLMCEWGSGFGVVTCLAAMAGFSAHGIEIEPSLVAEAQLLASDFGIDVEFTHGSFVPAGSDAMLADATEYSWFDTSESHDRDIDPADFDLIYCYPWPDEEETVAALFDHHAADGAALLTYHVDTTIRLRRCVSR